MCLQCWCWCWCCRDPASRRGCVFRRRLHSSLAGPQCRAGWAGAGTPRVSAWLGNQYPGGVGAQTPHQPTLHWPADHMSTRLLRWRVRQWDRTLESDNIAESDQGQCWVWYCDTYLLPATTNKCDTKYRAEQEIFSFNSMNHVCRRSLPNTFLILGDPENFLIEITL